jgi:hypothetical protein
MLWTTAAFLVGIMVAGLFVIAAFELSDIPRTTRAHLANVVMSRVICPALIGCFLLWAVSH